MTEKEAVNIASMAQALRAGAGRAAGALGTAAKNVAGVPGEIGDIALQMGRRGLNAIGGVKSVATGLGDATIGTAQRAAGRMVGQPRTGRFNPLNMGVGAGVMGFGTKALSDAVAAPAAPATPATIKPLSSAVPPTAGGFGGMSQRAQQMWGSLPTEAKWAIGAGVPLALLGGYMGRKGGLGGLGLGALGLGAAALGGASGGVFGDDARRFSGKMLYNLGSFFGGGGDDHASQLNMLSKLSPGMGATVLMGRDPNLSSEDATQQYEFLTKNRDMIQKMLPTLTAKSASDLAKTARCWKGYEPVPGKAPYSEDSCRPSGGKKKKEKKAASALFHHATKTLEPVVNGQKPSTENTKHVKVVHHNPDGQGVDLKPEEAEMKPDTKPVAD